MTDPTMVPPATRVIIVATVSLMLSTGSPLMTVSPSTDCPAATR